MTDAQFTSFAFVGLIGIFFPRTAFCILFIIAVASHAPIPPVSA